jgi:hypothetical protein
MYKAFKDNSNGKHFIRVNGNLYRGDWVEGHLLKIPYDDEGHIEYYIVEEVDWRDTIYDIHRYASKVIPETICEAVPGLKDSQGNQIYNHDIVECLVLRKGGSYSNWEQIKNVNHGKCRTLPMEVYYNEKSFGDCLCGYSFRPTEAAKLLINEYEKPVGKEKTQQHINWYNIKRDDLIKVIGTIFDKENENETR